MWQDLANGRISSTSRIYLFAIDLSIHMDIYVYLILKILRIFRMLFIENVELTMIFFSALAFSS